VIGGFVVVSHQEKRNNMTPHGDTDEELVEAEALIAEGYNSRSHEVAGSVEQVRALREALKLAEDALKQNCATWITVAPILEAHVYEPRSDGFVWNAYTRWGERAGKRSMRALRAVREALGGVGVD
jgi:hypothetical protein